jgi:hypothetical protein
MRRDHRGTYSRSVFDLSFVLGVVLGIIVTGFCAVGSYNRGFDSVRRGSWSRELTARRRAVKATVAARGAAGPALEASLRKAS